MDKNGCIHCLLIAVFLYQKTHWCYKWNKENNNGILKKRQRICGMAKGILHGFGKERNTQRRQRGYEILKTRNDDCSCFLRYWDTDSLYWLRYQYRIGVDIWRFVHQLRSFVELRLPSNTIEIREQPDRLVNKIRKWTIIVSIYSALKS